MVVASTSDLQVMSLTSGLWFAHKPYVGCHVLLKPFQVLVFRLEAECRYNPGCTSDDRDDVYERTSINSNRMTCTVVTTESATPGNGIASSRAVTAIHAAMQAPEAEEIRNVES